MFPPELEHIYREAIYELDLPGGVTAFRIGDCVAAEPFALITAHNPRSEPRSPGENAAANLRLESAIRRAGWCYVTGKGRSANGTHVESAFAVFGITEPEAVTLARQFGQAAFVWSDGDAAQLRSTSEAGASEAT